jgi:hypothetical protein
VHHPGSRGFPRLKALRTLGDRRAILAGVGVTLFLISFAGANPAGAMSDESDQYIKAIAAGRLDILGTKVSTEQARSLDYWVPSLNRVLTAYPSFALIARAYTIPSSLDPRYLGCTAQVALATCLNRSKPPIPTSTEVIVASVGTYQPFIFIPAGLVMRLAGTTISALLFGRLTYVLLAALLLLGAFLVALRARPGPVSIASLALCIAPTSVLVMSAISTSGPESAAAIAWWVALLAVTEPKAQRAAWWLALAAGLVCAIARTTGPAWLLFITIAVLVFRGRRAFWHGIRSGGRLAVATVAVSVAAGLVTLGWQLAVQPLGLEKPVATLAHASPSMINFILARAISTFGWGEAVPSPLISEVWALMVAVLVLLGVASALRRRSGRELIALLVTAAGGVAAVAAFLAFGSNAAQTQGRWFIALLVGVPIVSGWMASSPPATARAESTVRIASEVLIVGVVACLATFWWINEYRYAVQGGSLFFIGHTLWQPPLGWVPWIVCGALGLMALLAAVLVREPTSEPVALSPSA